MRQWRIEGKDRHPQAARVCTSEGAECDITHEDDIELKATEVEAKEALVWMNQVADNEEDAPKEEEVELKEQVIAG